MNQQFLTAKDLMYRWKCSYYVAICAMRSKAMGSFKIGKKFLAKPEAVERYEKQHLYR